jgi:sulfite oxidase
MVQDAFTPTFKAAQPIPAGRRPEPVAGLFTGRQDAGMWRLVAAAAAAAVAAAAVSGEAANAEAEGGPSVPRKGLPAYRMSEVRKHDGKTEGGRTWVTYQRGVYDVTEFAANHPGGTKILLAAGGDVGPFWSIYAVHSSKFVLEVLEGLRIGNLDAQDAAAQAAATAAAAGSDGGPFAHEPARLPCLEVRADRPFNAETPSSVLGDSFVTPAELFYVRNHLPVPKAVGAEEHTVTIEGEGIGKPLELSAKALRERFPQVTVTAALQCGGNRRREMSAVRKVHGLDWDRAAIGNAEWSGPRLCDVLAAAGLDERVAELAEDEAQGMHLQFEGSDVDEEGNPYGASIPLWRALSPSHDVVLALDMNGRPLQPDHGAPVRVLVPGVVGARSVKWLRRLRVCREESRSFWQRRDYKALGPATDWSAIDWDAAPSIQDMPVQAAILVPLPSSHRGEDAVELDAEDDEVEVSGYAWSGGGRRVSRVDVSSDGGSTWVEAELQTRAGASKRQARDGRCWSWSLWKATLPVRPGESELVARAVDSAFNTQPEHVEPQWSPRGLLSNSWSRVKLHRPAEDEGRGE